MTADQYIKLVIQEQHQPFAKVIVSHAKSGIHTALRPDQDLPEDDDINTIFLRVEDTA